VKTLLLVFAGSGIDGPRERQEASDSGVGYQIHSAIRKLNTMIGTGGFWEILEYVPVLLLAAILLYRAFGRS